MWRGILLIGCLSAAPASAQEAAPLVLEAKIPLGAVSGRIDHMAVDLARQRLFVAELGNDSVGIVDLKARALLQRLAGLKEPQGVGYAASADTLYVANAGDGSVRLYRGPDYAPAGRIALDDDADNVRFDAAANRLFVGYGSGGLAVIDPATQSKIADIHLAAHPEAFQLDRAGRIFVNIPDRRSIAVVDRAAGKQSANWRMVAGDANFPIALDEAAERVLVMFRSPARLGVFAMSDGSKVAAVEACGDADDIFVDAKRRRLYVSCGDGYVDVFDSAGYARVAHIPTSSGARTSLFVPELDRLFLAVRARSGAPAAIWIFRPT